MTCDQVLRMKALKNSGRMVQIELFGQSFKNKY